jgi:hypothetical protein
MGGIVLVTTKANADLVAKFPTTARHPLGMAENPPPFYTAEVPGKGIGLVANRTIKRGERIMAWQPTVIVHRQFIEKLGKEDQYRMLDMAITKLPANKRRAFMKQLGQFGGHKVSDILFTNSFQMNVGGEDGHHFANFPPISKYNHDCRPK